MSVNSITCCKCGALPNSLPFCYGGSDYDFHCFCCAKPPTLRCIQCNAPRDIELHKKHGPCIDGKLHVFVYTQPWPPFPEIAPDPHQRQQVSSPPPTFHQTMELEEEEEQDATVTDVISLVSDLEDHSEPNDNDMADIKLKPKLLSGDSYWVTVKQITQWDHCPRCNVPRVKQSGWINHAKKCAQDPKYKKRKFFIYIHTKGWCNNLIQDSAWDKHSDPINGVCKICRIGRLHNQPLPYQPKPPPRPNEDQLARMRRNKRRRTKLKRITDAEHNSVPQIIDCATLHMTL